MKDKSLCNLVFVKLTVQVACLINSFSSLCILMASQHKRRISSLKSSFIPQLHFFPSLLSSTIPNPTLENCVSAPPCSKILSLLLSFDEIPGSSPKGLLPMQYT